MKGKSLRMKKYRIGYTQGVYDMFHIGHLNLLNSAKQFCEYLIVGVNSDNLVQKYKNKTPVINEKQRAEIVRNIKAVDECVIVDTLDKEKILEKIAFEALFIGDDWKGSPRWINTERILGSRGIDVVFLPHTDGISSTQIRNVYDSRVQG